MSRHFIREVTDTDDDRFGDLCAEVVYDVTEDWWWDRRPIVDVTARLKSIRLQHSHDAPGLTIDRAGVEQMFSALDIEEMERAFAYRHGESEEEAA